MNFSQERKNGIKLALIILNVGTKAVRFYLHYYMTKNEFKYSDLNKKIEKEKNVKNSKLTPVFLTLNNKKVNMINDFEIFDLSSCYAIALSILEIIPDNFKYIKNTSTEPGVLINNLRLMRNQFVHSIDFESNTHEYEETLNEAKRCIENLCKSDNDKKKELITEIDEYEKMIDKENLDEKLEEKLNELNAEFNSYLNQLITDLNQNFHFIRKKNYNKEEINAFKVGTIVLNVATKAVRFYLEQYMKGENVTISYKDLYEKIMSENNKNERNKNLERAYHLIKRHELTELKDFGIFDITACFGIAFNILRIEDLTTDQNLNYLSNKPGVLINNLRIFRNKCAHSIDFKLDDQEYNDKIDNIKRCIEVLCKSDEKKKKTLIENLEKFTKINNIKNLKDFESENEKEELNSIKLAFILINICKRAVQFFLKNYMVENNFKYSDLRNQILNTPDAKNKPIAPAYNILVKYNYEKISDFQIFDLKSCCEIALFIFKIDKLEDKNSKNSGIALNNLRTLNKDYATFSKLDLNNKEYDSKMEKIKECIEVLCQKDSGMKDELIREIDEINAKRNNSNNEMAKIIDKYKK